MTDAELRELKRDIEEAAAAKDRFVYLDCRKALELIIECESRTKPPPAIKSNKQLALYEYACPECDYMYFTTSRHPSGACTSCARQSVDYGDEALP